MEQNRRRFLRKVPDELTVIQIERDEVGKVLNISEGGLSFSSISPVPRNLPVYFWFSFNLRDKIEAMGEVAWTDSSRTIGGLRFTQVSQVGREQMKKWLSRLRTEEFPEEIGGMSEEMEEEGVFAGQLVVAGTRVGSAQVRTKERFRLDTSPMRVGEPDRVAKFVSKARAYTPTLSLVGRGAADLKASVPPVLAVAPQPALGVTQPPALAAAAPQPALAAAQPLAPKNEVPKGGSYRSMFSAESSFTKAGALAGSKFSSLSFKGIESLVELVPLQRYLSAKKRQLACGVILGVCLSVAVMVPVMKFWNSRAHADTKEAAATDIASVKAASNNNVAAEAPPTTPPATATQPKPNYPVPGIFSDPILPRNTPPKKGTTPNLSAKKPVANTHRQEALKANALKAVVAKIPKPPPGPTQPPSNSDSGTSKKSGMNPTQLWAAVQAGSSKAAVELAELYIKGNGVPRNCQQARVLLLVASEKRNTAAIKRLQDLDRGTACQ